MIALHLTEAAAHAIVAQAEFYQQQASAALAKRWETAVDEAARSLLRMPERGAPCRFSAPALADTRWIPIPGFPRQMIFYRYDAEHAIVLVLQVLHGAQNFAALFDEEQ